MLARSILTFASIVIAASATCYFPDGVVSGADVPCDASSTESFCCYTHQACLSNGLCMTGTEDGVEQFARGTCTDPTWQSSACPNFCLDQKQDGNPVFSCNITGQDEYCCNNGCECQNNGQNQIVSFTGSPYTLTVIGVSGTYPNPSATTSVSSLSGSSSVTTTSSSLSISASTGTAAAATGSSSALSSSTSSGGSSSATAIGVGVGVGVGGAILIIAASAFFIHRRRRSRAQRQQSQMYDKQEPLPGYSSESGHPQAPYKQPHTNQQLSMSELGHNETHGRSEMGVGNSRPPVELSG